MFLTQLRVMNDPQQFQIVLNGHTVQVSMHIISKAKVFHIVYPDSRTPLNITIAENEDGGKFWTSVPEGRQEEAEFAGKVIASYLRENRRQQLCATITDKKSLTPSLFD